MNTTNAVRDTGSALGGAVAQLQTANRAAQRKYEIHGELIIHNPSDDPVMLMGHAFVGVVFSAAGTNPKAVGLVCIAAMAGDGAPLAIDALDRSSSLGHGIAQQFETAEWIILPMGPKIPMQTGRETAARILTEGFQRIGASGVTLLSALLGDPVAIVDGAADATSTTAAPTGIS